MRWVFFHLLFLVIHASKNVQTLSKQLTQLKMVGGGDMKNRIDIKTFLFQVMRLCWATMPEDRPGFRTIKEKLTGVAQEIQVD